MTEPFYLAAIPEQWEILGLKLRPFSLGHVILLHRIGSPFLGEESSRSAFDDLALAVLLCSETYENGLAILNEPHLPKLLNNWADRLTGMNRWSVRHGFRKAKPIEFAAPAIEFSDYIREHSKIPNYDFNPADFRELHCPEPQLVKVTLMRDMHFTEAELLDRCWGLCLWDFVTLRALSGSVKMIDQRAKEDAQALANELLAKIKAGEVNIPGVRN